jgi:hypothetical protein
MSGDDIVIKKPATLEEIRQLLKAEMKKQKATTVKTESGAGWTAHVKDRNYTGK